MPGPAAAEDGGGGEEWERVWGHPSEAEAMGTPQRLRPEGTGPHRGMDGAGEGAGGRASAGQPLLCRPSPPCPSVAFAAALCTCVISAGQGRSPQSIPNRSAL